MLLSKLPCYNKCFIILQIGFASPLKEKQNPPSPQVELCPRGADVIELRVDDRMRFVPYVCFIVFFQGLKKKEARGNSFWL